jgi:hypothetical protein
MAAVPRRLKRMEVYCPEYETTATIRINDAHSSGTDHLEVDYRSPDHSHFTIAIPDDWTDQDLLELIFLPPRDPGKLIGRLGKFRLTTSCRSGCSGSGKVRRNQKGKFGISLSNFLALRNNSCVLLDLCGLATRRSCHAADRRAFASVWR